MNKQELITRIKYLDEPYLKEEFILDLIEQLDEPKPLKLKDIISRMKQLLPLSRNEWIDEILHEFGDDFGLWKYKAGLEQGKLDGAMEREKVVVPQYVADWYEKKKHDLNHFIWDYLYNWDRQEGSEFKRWMDRSIVSFQTLVNMHQFGYEVEKEKRHLVKIKGVACPYLNYDTINELWFYNQKIEGAYTKTKHTRKELEEAGFGWVFDCPGIEIREVE